MLILVDMDDVLENLTYAWITWLNEEYGTDVDPDAERNWEMEKSFPDLTPAQVYAPLYDADFWQTVSPVETAAETLERLIDDGNEIYIVTTSNYVTLKTKMEDVLFRYYPFLDWSNVIVASRKQMIRGDVLIDDAPHNLVGGEYEKILLDAPHNRGFNAEVHGISRAHSWSEVYDMISGMSGRRHYVGVRRKG